MSFVRMNAKKWDKVESILNKLNDKHRMQLNQWFCLGAGDGVVRMIRTNGTYVVHLWASGDMVPELADGEEAAFKFDRDSRTFVKGDGEGMTFAKMEQVCLPANCDKETDYYVRFNIGLLKTMYDVCLAMHEDKYMAGNQMQKEPMTTENRFGVKLWELGGLTVGLMPIRRRDD